MESLLPVYTHPEQYHKSLVMVKIHIVSVHYSSKGNVLMVYFETWANIKLLCQNVTIEALIITTANLIFCYNFLHFRAY